MRHPARRPRSLKKTTLRGSGRASETGGSLGVSGGCGIGESRLSTGAPWRAIMTSNGFKRKLSLPEKESTRIPKERLQPAQKQGYNQLNPRRRLSADSDERREFAAERRFQSIDCGTPGAGFRQLDPGSARRFLAGVCGVSGGFAGGEQRARAEAREFAPRR